MNAIILWLVFVAIAAYLIGSFPTAYLVVRRFAGGKNVTDYGTGNVGSMNVFRITGSKPLLLLTAAGDMLKGAIAVLGARYLFQALGYDTQLAEEASGLIVVMGHNYSLFLKFKGGKGLATAVPVLLLVQPWLVAVWIATFFIVVGITRLMVLGQIIGTVVTPIVAYFWFPEGWGFVATLGVIVFIKHAPRIKDVVQGKEPKLYYKLRQPER